MKETREPLAKPLRVPRLALPHDEHSPTRTAKSPEGAPVSLHVARELCPPKIGSRCWFDASVPTSMTVPEASVNEYSHPSPGQHDIGVSGQVPALKTEAIAHRVEETPDDQLRAGVPVLDRPHVAGSLLGSQSVGHGSRHDCLRVFQEIGHVVYLNSLSGG